MPDNFDSTISGVTLQPLKLPSKSVRDVLDEQFGPVPPVQAPAAPTSFDQFPEVTADEAAAEGVDLDEFGAFEEPDAIDLSTPEELANDPEFDVETFVRQNPESLNDPFKRETLLEAERISRMRGLNLRKVAVDAIKASPGIVADFAKGARDTTDRLIGAAVQPGASAVLGGAQVALGQMDDQTRRELVKEIKREQKKALAELSAGSETAAFGLANLARTGSRKILNKIGGLTDAAGLTEGADLENASLDQLERDLRDDIAFREQAEAVARGQGAAAEAIGLDADTLRKEGIELDPAAIESISFADPLTLVATGGAFKLVSAGGKVLATTKTVQQATRLASKLGTTVVRGGRAAAGGTITGTGRAISATGRGVERFGQAARPALKAAGGVAGAVKGAELGGLAGAVVGAGAGASGGARIAQGIAALGRFGQRVGQATVSAGRQVAGTQAPNRFFRTISKIATSTPVQGAAIGAAAAAPLALAAETDEEAAQLLGAGIGLGGAAGAGVSGLRGVVSLRERFVGGRLLDPQSQPRPQLRESADYGSDAALDTSHKAAFDQMPPEQQALVNEFRELFRDEGEIYVQDPQQYGAQLARLAEAEKGAPLTPEEAAAVQQFADTHAVFSAEFPTAGGPKKVVLLNKDATGLTHDAGHLFESLLPEADRAALQQEVLRRYTPEELQGFKEAYERALNAGLPEGAPRRQLTAEELASEIIAENFSALFSNLDVSTLGTPRPLMDRLIQSAASLAERAGIDLTGGRGTPNLGARPSFGVTRMLENLVRQREAARRPAGGEGEPPRVDLGTEQPAPGPRNKRVTPTEQAGTAAPAPETAGIAAARAFAEQAKDPTLTKVVDDISAAFERKRGEVTPLEFEVLGAKEAEPGRVSTRQQRLEERLAADVAEAAGTAPEDVRQLFQAVQVPIRFEVRGRGANRTLQLLGMSLDKVMANVGILTREAAKRGIQRLVPYDLTPEGALTPDAWRRFQKDLVSYTENQQNGFRGDGRELIRPDESLGASIPEENPNYNPTVLPEEVGNFINLLQGIAPPRTARATGPGVPGNVKARTIAELNLRPVEEPARILPRDQAKQTFPTGETIGETNPLRNEFARSGFEIRDLHEVTERFNVDRIKSVKPRSELQFRAPFTDVVRAGFLPKTGPERSRFLPSTGAKPGSNDAVRRVARTYARESGIEFKPTEGLSKVDEPLMERIADEFDAAPNAPDDPAVRASYDAMIAETVAQYRAMEAAGVKIEPFKGEGEPYKNSAEMAADVRDNNHLYFLKTEGAFGESGIPANHALLEPSPVTIGGERLLNNDLFRAVHDYFGHAMEGTQFGPRGEFNAWRAHSEMFSPEAQGALAAETLAQNSWVNFGEHLRNAEGRIPKRGEEGFVPPQERPFAEQKMFVVSEDTIAAAKRQASEGVAPLDAAKFLPAEPDKLVAAVAQLDGAEFKKAMDSQEGGLTGAAVRLGKKFNSPEQVEILSVLEEQAKTQMREALTSGRMDEAMLLASKPQFFREARESATGTGSIGAAEARGQKFLPKSAGDFKTEMGRRVAEENNLRIERPPASGAHYIEFYNAKGDRVADISAVQMSPDTAHVDIIFVSPDLRGKGIAEALYRELGTDLQQAGVTKLMGGAVNDIPLRIRRKVFGDFELLTDALERPVSEQDALTRLRETREAEARGDTSQIEMVSATSRIDPNTRFLPKKREQKKLPLPPKAFIEPDGTFTKVNRATHDDYLIENSDALNKKYGTAIPKKQGKGDVRIGALAKGFVRVTYEPNQGRLTYEANAKTFGKAQRDKIFEHVADNLDDIDNIRISLVDDKGKVVKSADRRFFLMDEDSQKLDSIPFVTDEGRPERPTLFLPKGTLEDRGFAAEVEKIAKGEKEGETFNIDGTIFNPTDRNVDVVTVASVDLPVSALTQEGILSELQNYSPILENENVKPGLFRIARKSADGEQLVSVDINAIVPQEFRENTKAFSRDNNQESFYDLGKGEVVESGGDGRTVLKDPVQIALAIKDLVAGSPVDVQKIKGGDAGKSPVEDVQFPPKRDNQIDFDLDVERPATPVKLSKKQRGELNRKELREQFPEAVVPRSVTDTVGYDITSSPLYKKFKTDDARANAFADRLVKKFNEHKNEPETLLGLRWYDDFTPLLKARYGDDAPVFAELLAATSPNNTPRVNFQFAEAAYNQWKSGAFDNMIAKFEEGLGKLADGTLQAEYEAAVPAAQRPAKPSEATYMGWWVNSNDLIPRQAPRGGQPGPLFGMHSKAVLKVVTRRWLTENTGLKTNNFVQNLLGLSDEATIDLWAARTMREAGYEGFQDRWRILPENAKPVADAGFLFSQRAFRVAAERLGLKPQQLQGAMWFIEKKRWADKGWGELDLGDYRTEIERFIESEIPDPIAQQELF